MKAKELKIGDKVRVISATNGCMGARGLVGVITNKNNTNGLLETEEGVNVEGKDGNIWRIGLESECELIKNRRIKVGDIVRLKPSKRRNFVARNNDFRYGIVEPMIHIVDENEVFKVTSIAENGKLLRFLEDESLWSWDADWFEKVEPQPIEDEIKLKYCGRSTTAIHNGRVGTSFRSYDDNEDRKVGILIATMRALGFKKKTVDNVIDVLFDDFVDIKYLNNAELLDEVKKRMV